VSLFSDHGVVLRTYRLGEADRIIVLLTEEHGKVRAVAKGVRRTGSKFGARLEPLSHASLLFWHGRGELDTINQVEGVDAFRTLREDLDRMARGMVLLEVADQLSQEGHADPELYAMLVGALRTLADTGRDPTLVVPAFFWKALAHDGAGPVLDACVRCGDPDVVAFDPLEGGVLCRACRRGRSLSPEALTLIRAIYGGALGTLLNGPAPPGAAEVDALATEAMEAHLDRRLRSVRSVSGL
jgi:DNA repair protein RecO (recombination protein O)